MAVTGAAAWTNSMTQDTRCKYRDGRGKLRAKPESEWIHTPELKKIFGSREKIAQHLASANGNLEDRRRRLAWETEALFHVMRPFLVDQRHHIGYNIWSLHGRSLRAAVVSCQMQMRNEIIHAPRFVMAKASSGFAARLCNPAR